jgi:histidinol-phosphate aminotransferase
VARSERLLVTRTFSKAFGLAGLRLGYGAGQRALVDLVERARGPYKANAAAERAALAALSPAPDGREWVAAHAALARTVRDRMATELRHLGLAPLPSDANFLLVPSRRAVEIARQMRDAGVRVRAFAGLPTHLAALAASNGCALRIGVGPWPAMEQVLAALSAALA